MKKGDILSLASSRHVYLATSDVYVWNGESVIDIISASEITFARLSVGMFSVLIENPPNGLTIIKTMGALL